MKAKRPLGRMTVTISKDLINRLNNLRDQYAISVSAITEIAIRAYVENYSDDDLGDRLRTSGGRIRR
jgi:metal-responsive CopG/Arc/MetJ family transcriptional regulator